LTQPSSESQTKEDSKPLALEPVRYLTDSDLCREHLGGWLVSLGALAILARFMLGGPEGVYGGGYGWFFANVLLLGLISVFSIALHEVGHAVVAKLAGLRVYRLTIGLGAVLFQVRWGRLNLIVHAFPVAGYAQYSPHSEHNARLRMACATFGGIGFNLLAVLAVIAVEGTQVFSAAYWKSVYVEPAPLALLGFANFLLMGWSALPLTSDLTGPSDGLLLLNIRRFGPAEVDNWIVHGYAREVSYRGRTSRRAGLEEVTRALKHYPDQFQLLCQQAGLLLSTGNWKQSLEILLRLKADPSLPPSTKIQVLSLLAYAATMDEVAQLRPDLQNWTGQLFSVCAGDPWVRALRGRAVFASGRTATGLAMMRVSLRTRWLAPDERADIACWLAVAEAESGRLDEAERLHELARREDPECVLLPTVETAIAKTRDRGASGPAR